MTEEPYIKIALTLTQLRVLAKSISKTRDSELKKLSRLKAGTHVHSEVRADFLAIDSIDAEVSGAINELVGGL